MRSLYQSVHIAISGSFAVCAPKDDKKFAHLLTHLSNNKMQITVGIITVSDRASRGEYDDLGGPALKEAAEGFGWKVLAEALVPDEKRDIQRAIREQVAKGCELLLTTGGTGVALRDVTPEAVRDIAERE